MASDTAGHVFRPITRISDNRFNSKDSVGEQNSDNIYRFRLRQKSSLDISASRLQDGDVDLQLYKLKGKEDNARNLFRRKEFSDWSEQTIRKRLQFISQSKQAGKASESIISDLDKGVYYIRVNQIDGDTRYKLQLQSQAIEESAINTELDKKNNLSSSAFSRSLSSYVRVTSPNGGNTLTTGKGYWLNWSDNISGNVRLDLYKGGVYKAVISSSTASDGSFYWQVPTNLTRGTDYKLRIASTTNSSISDYSDSNFAVKADLKKYWFYYNFNPTNYRAADSYVGSVIAPVGTYRVTALDGSYTNSDFFDPRTSTTEMGLNGKYLVYQMEDYNDNLVNEAGRVFVNQYIDRDNGAERTFTPYKYSQGVQPSGTNYLGSESDYIQSSSTSTRFGLDYYEADPILSTDITIKLDFFGNFTTTQRTLIERAANNWRSIITKDMVPEGRLNIAVTQGPTELDGTSWDPGVWALTAFPYSIGTIAKPRLRQNLYTPYDNIQGVDYHTRIHFNSYALPVRSSSEIVRLATHEIGHALYLDEAQLDPLLGLDSVMDKNGLDPKITAGVYSRLEYLGYGVNRNPVLNWA